jgi:hypothetical protein
MIMTLLTHSSLPLLLLLLAMIRNFFPSSFFLFFLTVPIENSRPHELMRKSQERQDDKSRVGLWNFFRSLVFAMSKTRRKRWRRGEHQSEEEFYSEVTQTGQQPTFMA